MFVTQIKMSSQPNINQERVGKKREKEIKQRQDDVTEAVTGLKTVQKHLPFSCSVYYQIIKDTQTRK